MPLTVAALRRYPVKSMGGEPLEQLTLDARGVQGDRWYAVVDDDGRLASGKNTTRFRRRDAVFDHSAATGESGDVVVSGAAGQWSVGDHALDAVLSDATGAAVRVAPEAGVAHHDAGQVSLVGTATLEWCAERWGIDADPRRLRANLVLATDEPFIEEEWIGRTLGIGGAALVVARRISRCRTIDLDQDGVRAQGRWLRPLTQERDMCVAMYADVEATGTVRSGDAVTLR